MKTKRRRKKNNTEGGDSGKVDANGTTLGAQPQQSFYRWDDFSKRITELCSFCNSSLVSQLQARAEDINKEQGTEDDNNSMAGLREARRQWLEIEARDDENITNITLCIHQIYPSAADVDDELGSRRLGTEWNYIVNGPLEYSEAVLALVESGHHHLLVFAQ